ncbi:hypothetical protein [Aerococcus urinaeequi]|uniref:hypothetical protein n=1 Tax=Aerococcus urinaeequi TaxID=51665 RepID=UPI003ACB5C63
MSEINLKKYMVEANQVQAKIRREKLKKRKERTHQLIQKGALLEKYFSLQDTSPEDTEIFLKALKEKNEAGTKLLLRKK